MTENEALDAFLAGGAFAVVGASENRAKYGNKVFRCYLQNGRRAFPVNPHSSSVEGHAAYPTLGDLPEAVDGVSVITPPDVTERVVEDVAACGIKHLWLQPGAENQRVLERARELGLVTIAGGACLLVVLGYRESAPL